MNLFRFSALMTLAVVCSTAFLFAQTYQGRILGSVTDASGAVISGAKITIKNTATGVARSLTTTAAGDYVAPNLEPGPTA